MDSISQGLASMFETIIQINERFQLDNSRRLGEGALGVVYTVWDSYKNHDVAIKVVKSTSGSFNTLPTDCFRDLEVLERIKHPNIVDFMGFVKLGSEEVWLVYELCNKNLGKLIMERRDLKKPFSALDINHILDGIVSGVNYLHKNEIQHQNIKPSNVLLKYNMETDDVNKMTFKIADFDMSHVGHEKAYMAPEVREETEGYTYTDKADCYSIGIIAYELYNFERPNKEELTASVTKILKDNQILAALIGKLTEIDPDDRLDTKEILSKGFLGGVADLSIWSIVGELPVSYIKVNDRFQYKEIQSRKLGEGTYGKVYRGWDLKENKAVAIKILKDGFSSSSSSSNNTVEYIRELKVLEKINHRNNVKLIDFVTSPYNEKCFIFEICNKDLKTLITEQKKLKMSFLATDIYHILRDIVSGVNYLHQNNIYHRDIKPGNVLIKCEKETEDITSMTFKLTDFGLARFAPNDASIMTFKVGTLAYMAPEVKDDKNGDKYTEKADCYSIGITAAELSLLERPSKKELKAKISVIKDKNYALADLIEKLTMTNPDDRMDSRKIPLHFALKGKGCKVM